MDPEGPTVRSYPALAVRWSGAQSEERVDLLLAELDEFGPTAIDDDGSAVRIFFSTREAREAAAARVGTCDPSAACEHIDVPDDNWAERSQASITAVRMGGLVVAPPWALPNDGSRVIVIQPSMGFGTAHHASTRLCLHLLQQIPVTGARVLDVGTGSGVLAIAAHALGARSAVAADYDPDALENVRENLGLNNITSGIDVVQFDLADPSTLSETGFDLVLANLTGGMLVRHARELRGFIASGGTLIVSGVMLDEEAAVTAALTGTGLRLTKRLSEDEWVGLLFSREPSRTR